MESRRTKINWFPGHMTKALREMQKQSANVDCFVYVLDARIPLASINPVYDSIFNNKPVLYVLNKADMVPENELNKWFAFYSKKSKCITSNSTINGGNKKFISALKELNNEKIERYRAKGVRKTIHAMVIGIPNCGKSTLINSIVSKKRAATGNRPGVTRGPQWVNVDQYVDLLDTPGTLYPDFSDQVKASHLAMVGSIRDQILDNKILALDILDYLKNEFLDNLLRKYTFVTAEMDVEDMFTAVGKSKGLLIKGGDIDEGRTSIAIIQDFRKQAFGKIMLERYDG